MIEMVSYVFASISGYKLYRSCFGYQNKRIIDYKNVSYRVMPCSSSEICMDKICITYLDSNGNRIKKYKWVKTPMKVVTHDSEPLFSEYYFRRVINTPKRSPFMFLIFVISMYYLIKDQL